MGNILVLCEVKDGKLKTASLPAITFARQVAEKAGGQVMGVVIGSGVGDAAQDAARFVANVYCADRPGLDNYMAETPGNIMRNPAVTLAVWNRDWEENCGGYEIKGTAEYFMEGEWFDFAKGLEENEGEPCKGVIVVTIKDTKKMG